MKTIILSVAAALGITIGAAAVIVYRAGVRAHTKITLMAILREYEGED